MENYKQWMEQKLTSEDMDKLPKVVKPLSEQMIDIIWESEKFDGKKINYTAFARAIERAHGIVQKQKATRDSQRISLPGVWD